MFDIDGFKSVCNGLCRVVLMAICLKDIRRDTERSIQAEDRDPTWQSRLNNLVIDYLVHHGHHATAEVLARGTGISIQEPQESIQQRRRKGKYSPCG